MGCNIITGFKQIYVYVKFRTTIFPSFEVLLLDLLCKSDILIGFLYFLILIDSLNVIFILFRMRGLSLENVFQLMNYYHSKLDGCMFCVILL